MRKAVAAAFAVVIAGLGLSACEIRPHHDFTVVIGTDVVDADPGDGVCEATAGVGDCTLRASIAEANALVADAIGPAPTFTVTLAVDVGLSRPGGDEDANATGDLDLRLGDGSLTLEGGGHVVDAGGLGFFGIDRVLELHTGSLTVDEVELTNGVGKSGGGAIRTAPSTALLADRSTFRANLGGSAGGCVALPTPSNECLRVINLGGGGAIDAGGDLVIRGSTFTHNTALPISVGCVTGVAGTLICPAAWGGAVLARAHLVILSSTFDGNSTQGGDGSTIHAAGDATVVSSTLVADPSASGIVVVSSLRSSIVARPNCSDLVIDANANLVAPDPCTPGSPPLGPLADNGGATATRLPVAGSVIVDAVAPDSDSTCAGLALDQRERPRPIGVGCDVGAVERQPTDP